MASKCYRAPCPSAVGWSAGGRRVHPYSKSAGLGDRGQGRRQRHPRGRLGRLAATPTGVGESPDRGPRGEGVRADRRPARGHEHVSAGSHLFPLGTVTAPVRMRKLVAWLNTREAAQPGLEFSCPLLGSWTVVHGLRFLGHPGSKPLAQVVEDGCGGLVFQLRGRPIAHLEERSDLAGLLWRLRTLRGCARSQLAASASAPSATPGPPWITTMTVQVRNVSSSACGLKGFARVGLRAPSSAPLPTHVTDSKFSPQVVTVAPRLSASVDISWPSASRSCGGPRVGSLVVTLPGIGRPFVVRVGSPPLPVTPCRRQDHGRCDSLASPFRDATTCLAPGEMRDCLCDDRPWVNRLGRCRP